jgi:predicted DNA-binding transcriptional regulator YafY
MGAQKGSETRLIRLGRILRLFMERERIQTTWLSKELQTTPRTIQRDILLLKEAGFPLHEVRKGLYELSKDLVKNLEVFDDTELALVVALKNLVGQLGGPFQEAADGVLDRLWDCVTTMPVFVRIDDPVVLDNRLLGRAVRSIREKKKVGFQYNAAKPHPVTLDPYRVAWFGGFWYLVGKDNDSGIVKRYALDKISEFKLTKTCFPGVPGDIDQVLRSSSNIWFAKDLHLEATVRVDADVSDYFRRRKMYPSQEILEERPDGSLVVSYRVGHYEAIRTILRSWIPHISILGPEDFRKTFLEEVRGWVERQ